MARFGRKKAKRFSALTRVITGGQGIRIGLITPGIKRAKNRYGKGSGVSGLVAK